MFEGQPSDPTIIYMPLFNMQNFKGISSHSMLSFSLCILGCLMCLILMFLIMSLGEEEIKKEMVEHTTFVLSYIVEKMYHLLEKASANMRNNKGTILREI